MWSGKVAYAAGNPDHKQEQEPDKNTQAIVEFNESMYKSPDWYTTMIPLRDGVTVAMRL